MSSTNCNVLLLLYVVSKYQEDSLLTVCTFSLLVGSWLVSRRRAVVPPTIIHHARGTIGTFLIYAAVVRTSLIV
jgi:hypothetical protein